MIKKRKLKSVRLICFFLSYQLQFLELLEESTIALENSLLACLQNVVQLISGDVPQCGTHSDLF